MTPETWESVVIVMPALAIFGGVLVGGAAFFAVWIATPDSEVLLDRVAAVIRGMRPPGWVQPSEPEITRSTATVCAHLALVILCVAGVGARLSPGGGSMDALLWIALGFALGVVAHIRWDRATLPPPREPVTYDRSRANADPTPGDGDAPVDRGI